MPTKTELHYLGRVKRAPRRGEAYHYATIEPLVQSDDTGTEWAGPVADQRSRFQRRGLVHWHEAPLGLQVGSLWQFTIDEDASAERADRADRWDQCQLKAAQEPIEVLDLREWKDELSLRSTITADGIQLSPPPLARRVLLWLASGICVGPLLLKPGTHGGLWVLDGPEAHRDGARMPVYRLSAADMNGVQLEGSRWFLTPRLELGRLAGIQNWTPDAQVARSVLGRLRKMNPELVKAIGLTDNVFREFLDHVDNGRMGSTDPAVERARADRLRGIRDAIQRDVTLLEETAEALLSSDRVRREVDRRIQSSIDERVREGQSAIDAALAVATERLSTLQRQVDAKNAECAELDGAILTKRHELEEKIASFDTEVAHKLEEIARRPEAAFAEAAVMRALLGGSLAKSGTTSNGGGHTRSPRPRATHTVLTQDEPVLELADDIAIRTALAGHAGAGAFSIYAMLGLHAAFVSGPMPIVVGARAYELVHAYASAVAGGRIHWLPIGSSMTEPHDLLGRFDEASGRIIPSVSGLLNVVQDATRSAELHIVVLDGFNRAPVEGYLEPLLEIGQAARQGDGARRIPIANVALLAEDDPYGDMARLAWPPNLLIAGRPTEGTVTLPVPTSIWRFLALIDADDRGRPPVPGVSAGRRTPVRGVIPPKLWKAQLGADVSTLPEPTNVIALAEALSLQRNDAATAVRMLEILRLSGIPVDDAIALAVSATLIPRTGVGVKTVEESLRAADVVVPGWRTIVAEAQRLRI